MEVSVVGVLIGKLHVLVWNSRRCWDVVNFTALFTQVTNRPGSADCVLELRHWHVKLNRLGMFEFHVWLVLHLNVVCWNEGWVLAHFVRGVAYVVLKWRISWKIVLRHLRKVCMYRYGCLWLEGGLLSWVRLVVSTSRHEDVATMREIVQADVDFRCLRDLLHLHYSFGRKSYS